MNDFTKEELEQIKFEMDVGQIGFHASFTYEMYLVLERKIQSMIDNYCEHKESKMDCDGGISLVCKQCGATTMDVM